MVKRISTLAISAMLLVNLYGCVALFAGAAGGVGTAKWLSGKVVEEVDAPFDKVLSAAKTGLDSLTIEITKETIKENIAQFIAKHTDERTVWVDIRKISPKLTRIDVRVGANSDEAAARDIASRIISFL